MRKFTGKEYLAIAIANAYGYDKLSWEDRLNWVSGQLKTEGQLESRMAQAKEPMAYAKAMHALHDTLAYKATGFIMSLDATASGLQIMATLSGCEKTAANVNLVNTGQRENIYGKVAIEMNKLPGVNVTSDIVKKPVMTTFYGSKAQPMRVFGEDTPELDAFYKILNKELPGAMNLMEVMQRCWNPLALSHEWHMPDGHHVVAKVMQPVDSKIEVDEFEHATFTHRAEVNLPSEYGLSLAANIIHSVDGYIVREMIRQAEFMKFQIATIHDSFWAHPNDMQKVRQNYVKILANIADSNMIQNILREITGTRKTYQKSSKYLSQLILQSEYALS